MEKESSRVSLSSTLSSAIILSAAIISVGIVWRSGNFLGVRPIEQKTASATSEARILSDLERDVLPPEGVVLPVVWGDLGSKLVSLGVIDKEKFVDLYKSRGQFTEEYERLLSGENPEKLLINEANAGYVLNLFWAFGLASKNPILETGEMSNKAYGGAGNFASTGGWTAAKGGAMEHYSRHKFFNLTDEQQALVDEVSRNIFRPCCGNSTHFPDCNHGMAMLGLLELMASQGVGESEMYKAALAVNAYWFPGAYLSIAQYLQDNGKAWKDTDPKEILGAQYSSSAGLARISQAGNVGGGQGQGGSGCAITSGGSARAVQSVSRPQAGCGI